MKTIENLYLLTDKFTLVCLCVVAICYYCIVFIYYQYVKGNESEKFLSQKYFWYAIMGLVSISIYGAFLLFLVLLCFESKPINNLNLIYIYITIIVVPILHQLFLKAYIKWNNS